MLAETLVTQRSTCYSAVSALLTNSLPDCYNYSPFCHTHYLILQINTLQVLRARPFTKPLCWRLILRCCSALLQNLVGNSCLRRSTKVPLRKLEASGDVPPPLPIVISPSFCLFLFSLYLYPLSAPFLNPLSSFPLSS